MGNLGFYQISVQGLVKILPGEGNYTFCCNYTRAVVSVIKGQKMAQNDKKYVFALHISGTIHHMTVISGRQV